MGLLSLPLLYGAKINDLIVAGEWWRLVTPMFLVQDQHIGSVLPFLLYQKHTWQEQLLNRILSHSSLLMAWFHVFVSETHTSYTLLQHSGIPHVALSSWALLTFGPKVCRDYGIFTFCLIYILGGVSGNFMSFLLTPDPTVGGTVSWTFYFPPNCTVKNVKSCKLVDAGTSICVNRSLACGPISEQGDDQKRWVWGLV